MFSTSLSFLLTFRNVKPTGLLQVFSSVMKQLWIAVSSNNPTVTKRTKQSPYHPGFMIVIDSKVLLEDSGRPTTNTTSFILETKECVVVI